MAGIKNDYQEDRFLFSNEQEHKNFFFFYVACIWKSYYIYCNNKNINNQNDSVKTR
jgi:hypothetical protein